MTIEFVDPYIEEEYCQLKTKEDELIDELEEVQKRIQEIEEKEQRQ